MASLSSVRIPKDAAVVLRRLSELSDGQATALVEAVSAGHVRDMAGLDAAVTAGLDGKWGSQDIEAFIGHLMSMTALATSHGYSAEKVAHVVANQVSDDVGTEEVSKLSARLAALLSARDVVAFSKAADVSTEYDQVLHVSRIVTDIRPIFGHEIEGDPIGAVIAHSLRIDYFHEGRLKTTSFALNSSDLKQLRATLQRADAKEKALSGILDRIDLPEFDTGGDLNEDE